MSHGPSTQWGEDKAADYKSKLGIRMFLVYVLVYAGFIIINLTNPKAMGLIVFAGVNLACVYGFGLIILAIIMGLVYNSKCTKQENALNK